MKNKILNYVTKHMFSHTRFGKRAKIAYICTVFFIVLDLRLTKIGAKRCSFFYFKHFCFPINRHKIQELNKEQSLRPR